MRNILNISLPEAMAREIKIQMKEEKFASMSEYIRHIIRKYNEERLYQDLEESRREIKQGKGIKLNSLRDLR
jgi:Arc/MetJ-type ribon-helix-helix transcriptional regulator